MVFEIISQIAAEMWFIYKKQWKQPAVELQNWFSSYLWWCSSAVGEFVPGLFFEEHCF